MESRQKRLRQYREESFQNYKVNEFLDYMMQATEEDKDFWIHYIRKNYANAKRFWEWIQYGHCIRLRSDTFEIFCLSRHSHGRDVHGAILNNPWLKRDEQVYQNANSTFWNLIFIHLERVDDVRSFSQVSRIHRHVARKDEPYTPWIQKFLAYNFHGRKVFVKNPFEQYPLWQQFLYLSSYPKRSWKEWVSKDVHCFFLAIAARMGWEWAVYDRNPIYDHDAWTITLEGNYKVVRDNHDSQRFVISKPGSTYINNFNIHHLKDIMETMMRK